MSSPWTGRDITQPSRQSPLSSSSYSPPLPFPHPLAEADPRRQNTSAVGQARSGQVALPGPSILTRNVRSPIRHSRAHSNAHQSRTKLLNATAEPKAAKVSHTPSTTFGQTRDIHAAVIRMDPARFELPRPTIPPHAPFRFPSDRWPSVRSSARSLPSSSWPCTC
jgi:hypothetical protein